MARRLLAKRWILTTLLVLGGVTLCIRLGFWQLERLAWRQELNARIEAQIKATVLDLNQSIPALDQLIALEYRSVTVNGVYQTDQEIVLRNRPYNNQLGVLVLTPLMINGSETMVFVERGWIPFQDASLPARAQYAEPGLVSVKGIFRRQVDGPNPGGVPNPTVAPGETRIDAWNFINLDQIQQQNHLSILPVYIQQAPDPSWTRMPYRQIELPEISEGSHLGYAIQWFVFAAILGGGYPFFVMKQLGQT